MDLAEVDILTITNSVVTTMMGLDSFSKAPHPLKGRLDHITGWVQIRGGWDGAVVVHTSLGLVTHAACQIFGVRPEDAAHADLLDALAEITNMIGGNIKSLVPGPSTLSLPSVTMGNAFDVRFFGRRLVSSVLTTCHAQPLRVLMCERGQDFDSAQMLSSLA
jgi:chemotaxis protein CheX